MYGTLAAAFPLPRRVPFPCIVWIPPYRDHRRAWERNGVRSLHIHAAYGTLAIAFPSPAPRSLPPPASCRSPRIGIIAAHGNETAFVPYTFVRNARRSVPFPRAAAFPSPAPPRSVPLHCAMMFLQTPHLQLFPLQRPYSAHRRCRRR